MLYLNYIYYFKHIPLWSETLAISMLKSLELHTLHLKTPNKSHTIQLCIKIKLNPMQNTKSADSTDTQIYKNTFTSRVENTFIHGHIVRHEQASTHFQIPLFCTVPAHTHNSTLTFLLKIQTFNPVIVLQEMTGALLQHVNVPVTVTNFKRETLTSLRK